MPQWAARVQIVGSRFRAVGLAVRRVPEQTAPVKLALPAAALAVAVTLPSVVCAENPEQIVKRLKDEGGRCHYVLSICSDTARAEAALARLRTDVDHGDPATRAERIAAAEAKVARQVDLLTRAAAAVRQRQSGTPSCFRHCARLQDGH
jgi:hypothetical protein